MTNAKSYATIRAKIRKGCVVHLEKNTAFELIKARVAGVLKEQNFQLKSDEIVDEQDGSRYALFTTEKRAVGIVWDAKKKRYVLQISTVNDGEVDENWRTLALWLFDPETQNDQDAKSIANDFEDSLVQLNPKNVPVKREPTTNKKSKITMDGFVQNFVKLYPQYQDELDAHMQHYGQLLPDTFIDEVVAEYMMSMLTQRKNYSRSSTTITTPGTITCVPPLWSRCSAICWKTKRWSGWHRTRTCPRRSSVPGCK